LRQDYVTAEESRIAFARLTDVPLDRIQAVGSLSIPVKIPNTTEWAHIRRVWGAPDYVIAATQQSKEIAYCISE
jgi:hypothetical protein